MKLLSGAIMGCMVIFAIGTFFYLMGYWTQVNLEFWLSYIKGRTVLVPYWLALVISIIGNGVTLGFNLITELCKLAL